MMMLSIIKPLRDVYQKILGLREKSAQCSPSAELCTIDSDSRNLSCQNIQNLSELTKRDSSTQTEYLLERPSESAESQEEYREWYPKEWIDDHSDDEIQVSNVYIFPKVGIASIDEFNVDELRMVDEPTREWNARKRFILDNRSIYPTKDLINFSKVLINITITKECFRRTRSQIAELLKALEKYNGQDVIPRGIKRKYDEDCNDHSQGQNQSGTEPKLMKIQDETNKIVHRSIKRQKRKRRVPSIKNTPIPSYEFVFRRSSSPTDVKKDLTNMINFILIQYPVDVSPISILVRAARDYNVKLQWNFEQNETGGYLCSVIFNTVDLAVAEGRTYSEAIEKAAEWGLKQLQKYNYTIKVAAFSDSSCKKILRGEFENFPEKKAISDCLDRHNVGFKMMVSMGWSTTEGLGKQCQGIKEPIIVPRKLTRGGIGMDDGSPDAFVNKCSFVFEKFIQDRSLDDLVFVLFTSDEMNLIEEAASKIGFRTKRFGKKENRAIRVIRVRFADEMLAFLLQLGGSFGRYTIIEPTLSNSNC